MWSPAYTPSWQIVPVRLLVLHYFMLLLATETQWDIFLLQDWTIQTNSYSSSTCNASLFLATTWTSSCYSDISLSITFSERPSVGSLCRMATYLVSVEDWAPHCCVLFAFIVSLIPLDDVLYQCGSLSSFAVSSQRLVYKGLLIKAFACLID